MSELLLTIPALFGDHHTTAVHNVLGQVEGVESAKVISTVKKLKMFYNIGDVIPQISHHGQRVGVMVIAAENRIRVQEPSENSVDIDITGIPKDDKLIMHLRGLPGTSKCTFFKIVCVMLLH